jgi:hypothetical protein
MTTQCDPIPGVIEQRSRGETRYKPSKHPSLVGVAKVRSLDVTRFSEQAHGNKSQYDKEWNLSK